MTTLFGFNDLYWMLPVVVVFLAGFFVIYRAPRLALYGLGPAALIVAIVFFFAYKEAFFLFQSEGSAAGLVLPIVMWTVLVSLVGIGIATVRGALSRLDELERGEDINGSDLLLPGYAKAGLVICAGIALPYLALSGLEIAADLLGSLLK